MDFKINLNEKVKVKLTEIGINLLKERHNELNDLIHSNGGKGLGEFKLKTDSDGYTSFQLWDLMNTFGHLLIMGLKIPFETDIIISKG